MASPSSAKTILSSDPGRKYGNQDPKLRNNITCKFCEKVYKGGVSRLKQHFVGGFKNVVECKKCPPHVREEIKTYMDKKEMSKVENIIKSTDGQLDDYDFDDACEEVEGGNVPQRKKPKAKGLMDVIYNQMKKNASGGSGVQQTINQVCNKELRDRVCRDIARWFYDAGIPFNAATYDSFNVMIESIGQFGPGMKPPSMYELSVPLLLKEVKVVDNQINEQKKEWAIKGCSIQSDGWRNSVVQKDIINFMVNSPKGSVFLKSLDVSTVSKEANLLCRVLDAMVEEVGEENVVQIVTDNASAYKLAGQMLERKRKHLYWTPCAAHCIDLMLEDIGKQIPKVKDCLKNAMFANGYIYNFVGLVNLMRNFTNQRNLHRPAVTRFATSFITLSQFHRQKNNLRRMVISQEWIDSKWSKDPKGQKIKSIFLQETFWRNILYTLKLTSPLVSVFRLVDGERKPAMGYIYAAMESAKTTIKKSFNEQQEFYEKAIEIIDKRWDCQLHQPLQAAGHYLNPSIFYDDAETIKENEEIMGGLIDCIGKLSRSEEEEGKITTELSLYQNVEGLFGKYVAIKQRKTKAPCNYKHNTFI